MTYKEAVRTFLETAQTRIGDPESFAEKLEIACREPIICISSVLPCVYKKWLAAYPEKQKSIQETLPDRVIGDAFIQTNEKRDELVRKLFRESSISEFNNEAGSLGKILEESNLLQIHHYFTPEDSFMQGLYESRPEGDHMIESSNGTVFADKNGNVIHLSEGWKNVEPGCMIPLKFDFDEYREYWNSDPEERIDILNLAFAGNFGIIEPPAMDWREGYIDYLKNTGPGM